MTDILRRLEEKRTISPHEIISEEYLLNRLENIRVQLNELRLKDIGNIIFIDLDSFYDYADQTGGGIGIRALMCEIEPYLPLILSDDEICDFLDAAENGDISLTERLEAIFIRNSAARFISAVSNSENTGTWADIKNVCLAVRSCKSTNGRWRS